MRCGGLALSSTDLMRSCDPFVNFLASQDFFPVEASGEDEREAETSK